MTKNRGLLHIVEVKYNGHDKWSPYCMCYKNELGECIRRFHQFGNTYPFFRYRFSGSFDWHKGFVRDYV